MRYSDWAVIYITVTRNSNEIPLLNSNSSVEHLTLVNEGKSISFIDTPSISYLSIAEDGKSLKFRLLKGNISAITDGTPIKISYA